jgi:putative methyltransferase (TIGR04325 family)
VIRVKNIIKILNNLFFLESQVTAEVTTYDNPLLAEVVSKKTEIYMATREDRVFPNSNYLALLTATSSGKAIKRVTDFGGAAGIHYFLTKDHIPELVSWDVIETQSMTNLMRKSNDGILRHFTLGDYFSAPRKCDLLYLSSSIQYVDNPYKLLEKLFTLSPKYILISRTPVNYGENTVRFTQYSLLSQNGPGALPFGYPDKKISYEVHVPKYIDLIAQIEEYFDIEWVVQEMEVLKDTNGNIYPYVSILAMSKRL